MKKQRHLALEILCHEQKIKKILTIALFISLIANAALIVMVFI